MNTRFIWHWELSRSICSKFVMEKPTVDRTVRVDISIAPAKMPSFVRWDGENQYLEIRVTQQFMRQVAEEALAMNDDRLEVLPEARIRDPQIEAIGKMLLTELQNQ